MCAFENHNKAWYNIRRTFFILLSWHDHLNQGSKWWILVIKTYQSCVAWGPWWSLKPSTKPYFSNSTNRHRKITTTYCANHIHNSNRCLANRSMQPILRVFYRTSFNFWCRGVQLLNTLLNYFPFCYKAEGHKLVVILKQSILVYCRQLIEQNS